VSGDQSNLRKLILIGFNAIGLAACVCALVLLARLAAAGTTQPEIVWVTLGILINHFGAGLQTASNYDFGSSAGSSAKNRLLADKKPPNPNQEE
jgi:hypothetical protein